MQMPDKATQAALDNANLAKIERRKKTVKVDDRDFTFQHPGARWYIKVMDRCKGPYGLLQETYAEEILENVVISPRLTIHDFDDCLGTLNKLFQEVETFLSSPTK
jgi:hypothetical protein